MVVLVEIAESAGRNRREINNQLRQTAQAAGLNRIDVAGNGSVTYTSARSGNGLELEPELAGLRNETSGPRTAALPGTPAGSGLRKVAGARSTDANTVARVEVDIETEGLSATYGSARDPGARALAETEAKRMATLANELIEEAIEADWAAERIRTALDWIVDETAVSHVMATDTLGRAMHESGQRWFGSNLAQTQQATAEAELAAAGSGSVGLMGHLNNQRQWVGGAMATRAYRAVEDPGERPDAGRQRRTARNGMAARGREPRDTRRDPAGMDRRGQPKRRNANRRGSAAGRPRRRGKRVAQLGTRA